MTPGSTSRDSVAPTEPVIVVVTGLSGAGRSTTLHALEDLGYFCVDNLPTMLAPNVVEVCESSGVNRIALGVDIRLGASLHPAVAVLDELSDEGRRQIDVLFLTATDEALLRRFSESRRPHPVDAPTDAVSSRRGAHAILDAVAIERSSLAPMRARATRIIDTTRLSVHELRREILDTFGPGTEKAPRMLTRVLSFGFKYGLPIDAEIVFDVRFLNNPYFVPELRPLSGLDGPVRDYVLEMDETRGFLERAMQLLDFVLPKYEREGKSYLTVALGCTGGRHRSVAIAEELATRLAASSPEARIVVTHRDKDHEKMDSQRPGHVRHDSTEIKGIVSPPRSRR